MRNLAAYPIEPDEVIDLLREVHESLESADPTGQRIGDMRPLLIAEAIRMIKDYKVALERCNDLQIAYNERIDEIERLQRQIK